MTEFPLSECSRSFAKTNSAARFTKLFVFGDSYADIGNGHDPKNNTRTAVGNVNQPWLFPYGQSRGAPSGRYGSGLVLSDYLGMYPTFLACVCLRVSQLTCAPRMEVIWETRFEIGSRCLERHCKNNISIEHTRTTFLQNTLEQHFNVVLMC